MAAKFALALTALLAAAQCAPQAELVAVAPSDNQASGFAYNVADPNTGDFKSQVEHRVGNAVTGQYSLVDPDGTKRIVDYTADHNGFNAVIRREGISVHPPTVPSVNGEPPVVGTSSVANYAPPLYSSISASDNIRYAASAPVVYTAQAPVNAVHTHSIPSHVFATSAPVTAAPIVEVTPAPVTAAPVVRVTPAAPTATPAVLVSSPGTPAVVPTAAPVITSSPVPQTVVGPAVQARASFVNTQPKYAVQSAYGSQAAYPQAPVFAQPQQAFAQVPQVYSQVPQVYPGAYQAAPGFPRPVYNQAAPYYANAPQYYSAAPQYYGAAPQYYSPVPQIYPGAPAVYPGQSFYPSPYAANPSLYAGAAGYSSPYPYYKK
ncbi:cuticle protein-like [Plutella xylostella]|uniref:cuticle protein-like n=1 Tax=Plutella xylostella TaxID=51655 RepID=UPI00203262BB|nr:cuticle protein-like [Plutella xylostella]